MTGAFDIVPSADRTTSTNAPSKIPGTAQTSATANTRPSQAIGVSFGTSSSGATWSALIRSAPRGLHGRDREPGVQLDVQFQYVDQRLSMQPAQRGERQLPHQGGYFSLYLLEVRRCRSPLRGHAVELVD